LTNREMGAVEPPVALANSLIVISLTTAGLSKANWATFFSVRDN